jgi:hypothetical protein
MPQQALGREDHQRLAHAPAIRPAAHLPPEQVEVLRRRGAVGDLDVVFRRQRQEPFDPRAGVLRTLAFVAVRQ